MTWSRLRSAGLVAGVVTRRAPLCPAGWSRRGEREEWADDTAWSSATAQASLLHSRSVRLNACVVSMTRLSLPVRRPWQPDANLSREGAWAGRYGGQTPPAERYHKT